MKYLFTYLIALTMILFSACAGNESKTSTPQSTANNPSTQTTTQPNTNTTTSTTVSTGGVKHYICPNNCEGSGGDGAGTCPVCGSQYVHNAAFHSQSATTSGSQTSPNITPVQPPQSNEPAQNAAGVWHYVCPNGCAGGAGSAGVSCAKCGTAMTHNSAYHQ